MSGELAGSIKRLLPKKLKRAAKQALLARTFRRAVGEVMSLPPGQMPSRVALARHQTGRDHEGMGPDLD
jgi:hypothetical protein